MAAGKSKNINGRVDIHVHSTYSDGTMTPAELLAAAEERGVALLAIADHDVTAGSEELCRLSASSPVKCVPGVELTAYDEGACVHVLAYGYSFDDAEFAAFLSENRRRLDEMSDRLIETMERAGEPVSVSEYNAFAHDRRLGGWKALHYFVAKGIASSPLEGIRLYPRFGVGYDTAGFPTVAEICRAIHRASAVAVLAHPGATFDSSDGKAFGAKLRKLAEQRIDGIECYYPEHDAETVVICRELCDELGLYVTCGSDCHGRFTGAPLCSLPVRADELRLPLFMVK